MFLSDKNFTLIYDCRSPRQETCFLSLSIYDNKSNSLCAYFSFTRFSMVAQNFRLSLFQFITAILKFQKQLVLSFLTNI